MKDMLIKIRILFYLMNAPFQDWLDNVWRKDLDQYYCCNGREYG